MADSQSSLIPFLPQNHYVSVKLSDANFLMWKQQVLATVRGYGLEEYLVAGDHIPPRYLLDEETEEMRANPAYAAWHRQDQLLSAWLQSSLSESTMVMVVGLDSSHKIWQALETNYSRQSKAKLMQYKLQLQTLKKENLSMTDYLNKIKTCCDLLGSAGCRVSNEDHILHILAGLGSEYDPVMVTIASKGDVWCLQDVTALLLMYGDYIQMMYSTNLFHLHRELVLHHLHMEYQLLHRYYRTRFRIHLVRGSNVPFPM